MADEITIETTEDVVVLEVVSDDEVTIYISDPQEVSLLTELIQGPPGPQGEPGENGLGSVTYVHTQSVASTSWTINHDLGKWPSVTVVDSTNRLVFAMVEYIDENNLVVTVAAPFAGLAYLN